MCRGHTRREVRHALQDEFEVSAKAAAQTLAVVELEMGQELRNKRSKRESSQFAKLQHAQRLALNAKKGPDLVSLVQIIREQNRLLGLYMPSEDGGGIAWQSLPMVLVPLTAEQVTAAGGYTSSQESSTQTPSNGKSNGVACNRFHPPSTSS